MSRWSIWTLVLVNIGAWCFSTWLNNENHKTNFAIQQSILHNDYMILDMQVRTFHYARPHEGVVKLCPECNDDSFAHLDHGQIIQELSKRKDDYERNFSQARDDHNEMDKLPKKEQEEIWKRREKEAEEKWNLHKG